MGQVAPFGNRANNYCTYLVQKNIKKRKQITIVLIHLPLNNFANYTNLD